MRIIETKLPQGHTTMTMERRELEERVLLYIYISTIFTIYWWLWCLSKHVSSIEGFLLRSCMSGVRRERMKNRHDVSRKHTKLATMLSVRAFRAGSYTLKLELTCRRVSSPSIPIGEVTDVLFLSRNTLSTQDQKSSARITMAHTFEHLVHQHLVLSVDSPDSKCANAVIRLTGDTYHFFKHSVPNALKWLVVVDWSMSEMEAGRFPPANALLSDLLAYKVIGARVPHHGRKSRWPNVFQANGHIMD